jgi:sulfatase maturation enzyme AslB (radical SAM superfamily)
MPDVTNFHVGDIWKSEPEKLKQVHVDECTECKIYNLCGGRCLYQQKAQLWPEEGRNLICDTVFHLVNVINARVPEISALIGKKIIKKEQFEYEQFNGSEIIP